MEEMKKIQIEVISDVDPRCEMNYYKGKKWIMDGQDLPAGICIGAMSALLPWITCIKYDATLYWEKKGEVKVCCTDADYPVTFKISVVEDENGK